MRWGEERARSLIAIVPRDSLFALSPKLGGVTNFARLRSPLLGLEAALRTDRFGPELAFSLEADWSFAANTQSAGGFDTRARENFFALSAQVAFRQRLGLRTVVFAGAGPSLTLVTSRVRVDAAPGFTESGAAPGALLSAGVELRLSRAIPFGELRWSWQADPSFSTLRGPVSAVSLVVGSRFELR